MYHKALLLAIASTALAAHGSGSHSHLEKRFTFPIPSSKGSVTFDSPKVISGNMTFDGGMKTYGRGVECSEGEGGDSDAVFWVENGGTLKNLIIGSDQIEGVHCMGSCTIQNVWWEAVCEDALSLKTGSGPFTVIGGGAQGAEDKVIQHNSEGTVNIQGFTAYNFGKLYRSCGNCDDMYERHVTISGVTAVEGSVLAGINSNFGDTAVIKSDVCATGVDTICQEYEGNETGEEPPESGSGPSSACKYSEPLSSC